MKIHKGQGPILHETNKNMHKVVAKEGDFKKIMDQVGFSSGKREEITGGENLGTVVGGIQILRGTEQIKEPLNMAEKKQVIERLQETLDLVDFYAAKLADSSLSVKGITPLISHLEERLEGLQNMESVPGMPEKLRPIISDMAITIGAEIAKFKRGDYG